MAYPGCIQANTDCLPVVRSADQHFRNVYRGRPKRLLDLSLTILALPIILPIIAILWLFIRKDGGPGLFGHKRVGQGGKIFTCWKLRTMVPDAETKLENYLAQNPGAKAQWQQRRKLTDDPRVMPWGKFLRKTSLDELPQFFNVLRGEMSLVGPRPVTIEEIAHYGKDAAIYTKMRPGITGLWQVSGRKDASYADRVIMDVSYFMVASLRQDVLLLLKTVTVMMRMTGQ